MAHIDITHQTADLVGLVRRALAGEEIIISADGVAVARIVAEPRNQ